MILSIQHLVEQISNTYVILLMKKIFIAKINLIILKTSLNIKMLQLMVMYQIFINKKFNHFIKKIQEDVIIGILIQNLHQNVH